MAKNDIILKERIASRIFYIRGKKIMFDRDLAAMYGVTTGNLNKAVSRNLERFPGDDFMFSLSKEEFEYVKALIFQNGTSYGKMPARGGTRKPPRVFTEQGVAMLSSVLRSKRAVQVNIQIIRTFVQMREMLSTIKIFVRNSNQLNIATTDSLKLCSMRSDSSSLRMTSPKTV